MRAGPPTHKSAPLFVLLREGTTDLRIMTYAANIFKYNPALDMLARLSHEDESPKCNPS